MIIINQIISSYSNNKSFYIGEKVFCAKAGRKPFRDNLVNQFPMEVDAIDRYMHLHQDFAVKIPIPGTKVIVPVPL